MSAYRSWSKTFFVSYRRWNSLILVSTTLLLFIAAHSLKLYGNTTNLIKTTFSSIKLKMFWASANNLFFFYNLYRGSVNYHWITNNFSRLGEINLSFNHISKFEYNSFSPLFQVYYFHFIGAVVFFWNFFFLKILLFSFCHKNNSVNQHSKNIVIFN